MLFLGIVIFVVSLIIIKSSSKTSSPPNVLTLKNEGNGKESNIPNQINTSLPNSKSKDAQVFKYYNQVFISFLLDLNKQQVMFLGGEQNSTQSVQSIIDTLIQQKIKLRFATNAGIFRKNGQPEGLFIKNNKVVTPLNLDAGKGNFYLRPNGVFFINNNGQIGISESADFKAKGIQPKFATQSGPLLMHNGSIHPAIREGSKNLKIRNGVGIISPSKAVFIISKKPVNFYDFTMAFVHQYGCEDILYLDGVISEMYLPEIGKVKSEEKFSGVIGVIKN